MFGPNFEKRFGDQSAELTNKRSPFSVSSIASNFVFSNINTNLAKSVEFTIVDVYTFFMLFFFAWLLLNLVKQTSSLIFLKKVIQKLIYITWLNRYLE